MRNATPHTKDNAGKALINIDEISKERPVLIAGPTASGKTSLAIEIATRQGGVIVNADALQVYSGWRILTARPSDDELGAAPHHLYGHVPYDAAYSTGAWLRDVRPYLTEGERPIIVGGTGLNFSALTEGLADIPPTDPRWRAEGDTLRDRGQLDQMIADLDETTASRIDLLNPMRVQRAWEVQKSTGRGLAAWQDNTPAPDLPLSHTTALVMTADKDWLNDRIARRFRMMIDDGAIDEARQMLPHWDPMLQSSKAIGAPEMIAYLRGDLSLDEAIEKAVIASRQYAKRQRTWFRSRMKNWTAINLPQTKM